MSDSDDYQGGWDDGYDEGYSTGQEDAENIGRDMIVKLRVALAAAIAHIETLTHAHPDDPISNSIKELGHTALKETENA